MAVLTARSEALKARQGRFGRFIADPAPLAPTIAWKPSGLGAARTSPLKPLPPPRSLCTAIQENLRGAQGSSPAMFSSTDATDWHRRGRHFG